MARSRVRGMFFSADVQADEQQRVLLRAGRGLDGQRACDCEHRGVCVGQVMEIGEKAPWSGHNGDLRNLQ